MFDDKRFRVLIIDDDISSITALNSILGSQYILHVTKCGREGIMLAEKFLPDIILLDVVMPAMDGFEVLDALKSSVITRDIPVILVSSCLDRTDEEKGLALGAVDYIRKPIVSEIIRLRIGNLLKQISSVAAKTDFVRENNVTLCEYMAKISLEMRTPLNGIISIVTRELYDNTLSEAQFEAFTRIFEASNVLMGMIDELSDIPAACKNQPKAALLNSGRILVIDDSEMCLDTAKRIFSLYGFKVDTARSGIEAIEIIQGGHEYAALFVDYLMPDLDGVETVRRIRELGCVMPVIALTADCAADRKEIFIEGGFNDFVTKPIDFQTIGGVLKRVFRG